MTTLAAPLADAGATSRAGVGTGSGVGGAPAPTARAAPVVSVGPGAAVVGTVPFPTAPDASVVAVGTSPGGLPPSPAGAGTRPMTWPGISPGTAVTVRGGDVLVDTADLDALAASLTTAADWLDDALAQIRVASSQVSAALAPAEPGPSDPTRFPLATWYDGDATLLVATPTTDGATWTVLAPHVPGAAPTVSAALTFEALRSDATAALDALTSGPGSLVDVASRLRDLASDLTSTAEVYAGAETAASQGWSAPAVLTLLSVVSGTLAARTGLDETVLAAVAGAEVLTLDGMLLTDEHADLLHGLSAVLADAHLSSWARQDALAVAALMAWAREAGTGTEGEVVQSYLARTAARLDPEIRPLLPDRLPHGSGTVSTDALSPLQRVAAYLATSLAATGAARYGARTGVTVTPHAGLGVTVPPGGQDPLGLGTAVPVAAWTGTAVAAPAGAADLIRASDRLTRDDEDRSTGVVSVLRTEHADGTRSWTVLVPGTADWGAGGSNPQDMLTNLEAVAGLPTDMETAVVTAMRQAGIAPGEDVALYGHSQGAVTATNLAADPALAQRFHVTTLLTAGGPVAGAALPSSVHALHLENAGDAVPGTDGADTPSSPTRMTVTLDTTGTGDTAYPHGSAAYAAAVDGLGGDPAVDAWNERLAAVTGAGEPGARTTELVFDLRRETPVTAWERTDLVVDDVREEAQDGVVAAAQTAEDGVRWVGEHSDHGWDGQGQRWRD